MKQFDQGMERILHETRLRVTPLIADGRVAEGEALCLAILETFEQQPNHSGLALREAAGLYHSYSMLAVQRQDLKAARTRCRKSLRLSPGRHETWQQLALVCDDLYQLTGNPAYLNESQQAGRNAGLLDSASARNAGRPGGDHSKAMVS